MLSEIFKMMDRLAVLHATKSPGAAAALGFLFGGIGLGIYLRSFVDCLFPLALVIAASVVSTGFAQLDPQIGLLAGSIVASLWGYFRVENSNRRRNALPMKAIPAT
jgi:hypothetical protein